MPVGVFGKKVRASQFTVPVQANRMANPLASACLSVIEVLEERRLFAYPSTVQPLPYSLDFSSDRGGILDKNGNGTGFTRVQANKNGNEYQSLPDQPRHRGRRAQDHHHRQLQPPAATTTATTRSPTPCRRSSTRQPVGFSDHHAPRRPAGLHRPRQRAGGHHVRAGPGQLRQARRRRPARRDVPPVHRRADHRQQPITSDQHRRQPVATPTSATSPTSNARPRPRRRRVDRQGAARIYRINGGTFIEDRQGADAHAARRRAAFFSSRRPGRPDRDAQERHAAR